MDSIAAIKADCYSRTDWRKNHFTQKNEPTHQMKPIAIFYHCLFFLGQPPKFLEASFPIVKEQMRQLRDSGLMDQAQVMVVGVNGSDESHTFAKELFPQKSHVFFNGLECRTENMTIRAMEQWVADKPGWNVLYFHSKGATHPLGDPLRSNWSACMMRNLVANWRQCVSDLESGCDAVGCHWMTGDKTPPGQSIFAGNFWWAQSDYLMTIPSIMLRDRIIESGLGNPESRYESEVWIGNGTRFPKVKDYHPEWIDQCKP